MSTAGANDEHRAANARRGGPLVAAALAAATGIVVDRYWPCSALLWWTLAAAMWLTWLTLHSCRRVHTAGLALLMCVALIAAAWHHSQWQWFDRDELGRFARREAAPTCVEVRALEFPQLLSVPAYDPLRTIPAGQRSRLDVNVVAIRNGRRWQPAAGRATLLVEGHLLGVGPGDRLKVFAQLARPTPANNPGEFDFARYARADRKLAVLRTGQPDCVVRLAEADFWQPGRLLGRVRTMGNLLLWRNLSPRYVGLAAAVLLGERHELSDRQSEAYFTTGTVHLLVVSGLHVGILAGLLLVGLRLGWVPRRMGLLAVIGIVVLFASLTSGRPPVVRAAVLITIYCSARIAGRRAAGFDALALAAIVVLAWNPAELFRTGAQLSFLAVATLIWLAHQWQRRESRDPLDELIAASRPWPVRAMHRLAAAYWRLTVASAAVWLVALPLVMARFHLLSPAAVVLTPLVWPLLVVGLAGGFALLAVGWLVPPAAAPLAWLCDASLGSLQSAVDTANRIPGNHLWVPGPAWWWLVGFYAGLGVFAALATRRPPLRAGLILLACWVAVGFAPRLTRDDECLRTTFVSVGHGSSVLMELPGGRTLLYDAGRLGSPTSGLRPIAAVLWSRGIRHVDAVVVSHADADHYNALPSLLERFSAGVVYVSPVMFEDDSPALAALQQAAHAHGVPLREIWSGDRLSAGPEVTVEVLHPPRVGVLGSDNANSIVLAVKYQGRRILLPGDLESPGLDDVMAESPQPCDVLLAPHHGSRRSDPPGFAAWSRPGNLIISGGDTRDLPEVSAAYRAVGSRVIHTAESGAVEVEIREGELQIATWREMEAH